MGYRTNISNIDIQGELFDTIKENLFKQRNIIVKKVIQISKDKSLFMIELKNKNHIRLDMGNKRNKKKFTEENLYYRNLLYKNNIHIPCIIRIFTVKGRQWVISEWIEGTRANENWNSIKLLEKCGEEVAKINSIKDPTTGFSLHIADFTNLNLIWTKYEEIYFIDIVIYTYEHINNALLKIVNNLKNENRINAFLTGYSKVINIDKLIK
jgi:hypothetical protein